jgi:DNA-binding transcriptional ArsR family regulator
MLAATPNPDAVFRALADPTRRAVLARLARGPAAVSELARPHPLALPTFVQHLRVLEEAGLIRTEKRGRIRTCHYVPDRLAPVQGWLDQQRSLWERRLDQLDAYLLTMPDDDEP